MCSRRNRRCSRHETVKIYVLYVPALCLWSVCRAVLLRDDLVCRPGGRPFAGMRVRPCGAALFRAAPAAEKLGLAADRGCTCGRRALYPACAADREHFRACGRRNTAILRGDSGHSDRSSDRYFRYGCNADSDPDCRPLCASLQLDGHAKGKPCISAASDAAGSGAVPDHSADASGGLGHFARCRHPCAASSDAAAPRTAGRRGEPAGAAAGRAAGAFDRLDCCSVSVRYL